jgi:hypothetical protein
MAPGSAWNWNSCDPNQELKIHSSLLFIALPRLFFIPEKEGERKKDVKTTI